MGNKLAMEESLAEVKEQALTGPKRRLPIFVTRTTLKDTLYYGAQMRRILLAMTLTLHDVYVLAPTLN